MGEEVNTHLLALHKACHWKAGGCYKLLFTCKSCPTLRPNGQQHTRLPCPSPFPGVCSNSLSIELMIPSNHLILLSSIFPSIRVFSNELALCIRCPSIGASASAPVLPMNIQGWFPLGWTGLVSMLSKELSRVFSSTTVQKHQSLFFSFLYGPTLISVHDYWKNHSFDNTDLCQQSDIAAF